MAVGFHSTACSYFSYSTYVYTGPLSAYESWRRAQAALREETGGTRLKGLHRLRGMGWAVIGIAYALVPNMGNVGRMGGGVLHENKIIKNNHSCSAAGDGVAIDSKSESAMGSYTSEL